MFSHYFPPGTVSTSIAQGASLWREGPKTVRAPADPSTTPPGVHQHRNVLVRDQSRPELVKPSLIVGEEPYLRELPLSIDLERLCQDEIEGLTVPLGDSVIEGEDVVDTGKERFQLGLRAPTLDGSGQPIHHRISS